MNAAELGAFLDQHVPSISDEDEEELEDRVDGGYGYEDLALRTCGCGQKIEGFYEYLDHLRKEVNLGPRYT